MGVKYSIEDLKKAGIASVDGVYKKLKPASKVEKLPPLIEKDIKAEIAIPSGKKDNENAPFLEIRFKKLMHDLNLVHPVLDNKKIKNATKTVNSDGVKFDSKLEEYLYNALKAAKIDFEFQKVFILQHSFKYRGELIRPLKIIIDFYLPVEGILLDSKGFQTYDGKIKHKCLKSHLKHILDMEPEIIMPSTKKQIDELINRLIYDKK